MIPWLLAICWSIPAHADTVLIKNVPAWSKDILTRSRAQSIKQFSAPIPVAGTRGARAKASDLYWKSSAASVQELLKKGEECEAKLHWDTGAQFYRRALAQADGGRDADRAALGLALCDLNRGRTEPARMRLERLLARSDDASVRLAAVVPLAVIMSIDNEKPAAIDLLRRVIAESPDHPLASQAEAAVMMMEE